MQFSVVRAIVPVWQPHCCKNHLYLGVLVVFSCAPSFTMLAIFHRWFTKKHVKTALYMNVIRRQYCKSKLLQIPENKNENGDKAPSTLPHSLCTKWVVFKRTKELRLSFIDIFVDCDSVLVPSKQKYAQYVKCKRFSIYMHTSHGQETDEIKREQACCYCVKYKMYFACSLS